MPEPPGEEGAEPRVCGDLEPGETAVEIGEDGSKLQQPEVSHTAGPARYFGSPRKSWKDMGGQKDAGHV